MARFADQPGFVHCEDIKRDHQHRADDGRAGTVHPEAGEPAYGQDEIRADEDQKGREHEKTIYLPAGLFVFQDRRGKVGLQARHERP